MPLSHSRRPAALLILFLLLAVAGIAYQRSHVVAADLMTNPDYNASISVSGTPVLNQSVTITFVATPLYSVGTSEVSIQIPGHYTIVSGSPSGYSTTTAADKYVTWTQSISQGSSGTFTLVVQPTSAGGAYEQITGSVRDLAENNIYGLNSDEVWARVGVQGGAAGAVTDAWPYGMSFTDNAVTLTDANGNAVNAPTLSESQLPVEQPLQVGVVFASTPAPQQAVNVTLTFKNTISSNVAFDRTIVLPSGWQLVSGQTTTSSTLTPSQTATQVLSVLPGTSTGTWIFEVGVDLASGLAASGYTDFTIQQYGSLSASGGALTTQRKLLVTTGLQDQESCWCPPAPQPGGIIRNVHINGHVNIHAIDTRGGPVGAEYDTPGADLRVVIYARYMGTPNGRFVELVRLLTDNNGNFETCVWAVPTGMPLVFEVSSADTKEPGVPQHADQWTHHSIKTLGHLGFPGEDGHAGETTMAYAWYSAPYYVSTQSCPSYIATIDIPKKYGAPFFTTTFVAKDHRDYVASYMGPSIHSFPVTAFWPSYGSHYNGQLNLKAADGWHMRTISHEYGHHVHNSNSGGHGTSGSRMAEGWATYYDVTAESEGFCRGRCESAHQRQWLEDFADGGWFEKYRGSAAYMWDIAETGREAYDQLHNCNNAIDTMDTRTIRDIFQILDDGILDVSGGFDQHPPLSPTLYTRWLDLHGTESDGAVFRTISYNHGMADDTSQCTNPTPPLPTPTPTPTS